MSFLHDVTQGLSKTPKSLPCKYFYDDYGSKLFERICDLEEYYIPRLEMQLLSQSAEEIAHDLGSDVLIIEPGAGAGRKVSLLLDALDRPAGYIPADISPDILARSYQEMQRRYADLVITPSVIDFTNQEEMQSILLPAHQGKRVVFFPGSTIGNFMPKEASLCLRRFTSLLNTAGDMILVGFDLMKDEHVLRSAYDDSKGVTAAFNKNLLRRMNRELQACFDLDRFVHHVQVNKEDYRVELYLKSIAKQRVTIGDYVVDFANDELIHTEYSYKYTLEQFSDIAAQAGLKLKKHWVDKQGYVALVLLEYC